MTGAYCAQAQCFNSTFPLSNLITSIYLGPSAPSSVREIHLCPDIFERESGYK